MILNVKYVYSEQIAKVDTSVVEAAGVKDGTLLLALSFLLQNRNDEPGTIYVLNDGQLNSLASLGDTGIFARFGIFDTYTADTIYQRVTFLEEEDITPEKLGSIEITEVVLILKDYVRECFGSYDDDIALIKQYAPDSEIINASAWEKVEIMTEEWQQLLDWQEAGKVELIDITEYFTEVPVIQSTQNNVDNTFAIFNKIISLPYKANQIYYVTENFSQKEAYRFSTIAATLLVLYQRRVYVPEKYMQIYLNDIRKMIKPENMYYSDYIKFLKNFPVISVSVLARDTLICALDLVKYRNSYSSLVRSTLLTAQIDLTDFSLGPVNEEYTIVNPLNLSIIPFYDVYRERRITFL